jgi:hypothetical protein
MFQKQSLIDNLQHDILALSISTFWQGTYETYAPFLISLMQNSMLDQFSPMFQKQSLIDNLQQHGILALSISTF